MHSNYIILTQIPVNNVARDHDYLKRVHPVSV